MNASCKPINPLYPIIILSHHFSTNEELFLIYSKHGVSTVLQTIATKRGRFPDLDIIEINSSFVFLADL